MSFGDRVLFSDLTFEVSGGVAAALMGPSGAGKSTLLAGLAGVIPFSEGSSHIDGLSAPVNVSWMFQNSPLLYRRTALDNVAVALELRGTPRELAIDAAYDLLADVGLTAAARTVAHRLSGGERQRVAVARAMAARGDLLLADEPTASLDSGSRELVVTALLSASRSGAALVIATHDPWVASQCDFVVELQYGEGRRA